MIVGQRGSIPAATDVTVYRATVRDDPSLITLLDERETARLAQLRRPADRLRFVTVHALARLALATRVATDPRLLSFTATCGTCGGAHGKPELPGGPPFSLSTAAGMVLVAIGGGAPVGVDVEAAAAADFDGFDEVALTAAERAVVAGTAAELRANVRTGYWVGKEAVLKAAGRGLALAPNRLELAAPGERPRVLRRPIGLPDPVQLEILPLGAEYQAALAVLSDRPPSVRLTDGGSLLNGWEAPAAPARTATR